MTPSLPVPQEPHPDQPDDAVEPESAGAPVITLPPLPRTPTQDATTDAARAPRPKKSPSKKGARKKPVPPAAPAPPAPPVISAQEAAEAAARADDDRRAAALPAAVATAIPPMPPLPAAAPEIGPEPVAVPAPIVEPDLAPESEIAAELDATPAPEPDVLPEPGAVVAPESEPEVAPAPEPAPEVLSPTVPDAAEPALVLRGITKVFGETRAVDGIDLTIPAGTFYGLVGPNGAGKTTTLSMIAGLLRPDRGTVRVSGIDAASDPIKAKRMMGVLPDRLRTFDRLTGRQLLYYYGVLRGLKPAIVESRTADLARAFDLSDALGRVVSDYSAGMLKKVMLAGAMIHSPRVLVLDEPFEAVDPVSSAIILEILSTYVAHGGTVVLSSHGMELVERVCTRVAVIVAGQVLAEGTIDEVRGELSLEQRFVELAGGLSDVEGLEWLHTFSA